MTEQSETSGATRDTSEGIQSHDRLEGLADAATQVNALGEFLRERFPGEVNKAIGPNGVETPVQTAIRLLTHLSAREHPALAARCPKQFCNKPAGHKDNCGWVNV